MRDVAATKGKQTETYHKALSHIQHTCRDMGIDAALQHVTCNGETIELDALLLCDRLGAGQQIAAQAGWHPHIILLLAYCLSLSLPYTPNLGYPIITIPIGLDTSGIPIGLSLQHRAWHEGTLIKWASVIEDLVFNEMGTGRIPHDFRIILRIIFQLSIRGRNAG